VAALLELVQRPTHRGEGEVVPRNLVELEQADLQALRLVSDDVSAGPESLEVGLFEFDKIPWDDLAFPSVRWALHQFQESRHLDSFAAYTNPPGETGDF